MVKRALVGTHVTGLGVDGCQTFCCCCNEKLSRALQTGVLHHCYRLHRVDLSFSSDSFYCSLHT